MTVDETIEIAYIVIEMRQFKYYYGIRINITNEQSRR